jgi:signal transduction histidine kinase
MQMLALASASLTVALLLVVATTDADSPAAAISGVVGFVSALAFLLGLAPPGIARLLWRRPEQQRLQAATAELLTLAMTEREVAARVLRPAAEIVGARAAAVLDADGRVVVAHGLDDDVCRQMSDGAGPPQVWHDAEPVRVDYHGGAIVVWTTPFAPFFGTEELRALRSLGAFLSIAMDRVRLFAQEHETRIALERANELQANFVALAAHELRTPVTTIHGFVHTINRLGERIDVDQKAEIMETLEQQTERMAKLVEQLLDLSRLEAEAIQITPEPVDVSTRLNELATLAAGARSGDVEVDAPRDLVAAVDSSAFERVISNLITNALRYGAPPVIVRAKQTDNHFRVSVEDRGPGVSADFVPNLFERFSRSESSRARAGGTGLGLAIARAYARAHGGDLFYEPVRPHGARFELVVPRRAPSV